MQAQSSRLKVAIIGGGLAGASLFRGLTRHAHLDVNIFESAPEFREKGQGIGFSHNAIGALELLGLKECLHDAGAVRIGSARIMKGEGPDAGRFLLDIAVRSRGIWIVQRSDFLRELFKGVEPDRMHAGKKLARIEQHGEGSRLYFEDGSRHTCDILIGADGIHSKIRKFIVGEEHKAAEPVNAGFRAAWCLRPVERAVELLGPELVNVQEPRQFGWVGRHCFVMHDLLANNTLVQCVIDQRVPVEEMPVVKNDWTKMATKTELQAMLKNWDPRLRDGMVDLVTNSGAEEVPMIYHWHHLPIDTFVKEGVAIVGDAAGAMTPFQGSGGGMAMEDAYLLSELFEHATTIEKAHSALRAYDAVNRPRRTRLIQSSFETGQLMEASDPVVGNDGELIKQALQHKWDWILDVDLEEHRSQALRLMA